MRLVFTICVFVFLAENSESRVYERCRLAKELYYVYGIAHEDIPYWLCQINESSAYDTSLVTDKDGNRFHGLMQFFNRGWCLDPNSEDLPDTKMCNSPCSALSDDNISNDIKCITDYMRKNRATTKDLFEVTCKHKDPNIYRYLDGCNI